MSTDPTEPSPESFRTYRGRTLDELLPRIAEELGPDAIILREREGLVGGVGGFFARRFVEVDACPGEGSSIDVYDEGELDFEGLLADGTLAAEPDALDAAPAGAASNLTAAQPAAEPEPGEVLAITDGPEPIAELEPGAEPEHAAESAPTPEPEPAEAGFDQQLEVASYWLEAQADETTVEPEPALEPEPVAMPSTEPKLVLSPESVAEPTPPRKPVLPPPTSPPSAAGRRPEPSAHDEVQFVTSQLTRRGADPDWARWLVSSAKLHAAPLTGGVATATLQTLAKALPSAAPLPADGGAIAVIGAGGAGKTRVVAALANAYRATDAAVVNVFSLQDQAGSGELLELLDRRVPLQAVDANRARQALALARSEGIAILDTGTCTPTDPDSVDALSRELYRLKLDAIYIALPATLSLQAARNTVRGLWALAPTGLVITHADETDQLATAAEVAIEYSIPLVLSHGLVNGASKLQNLEPYGLAMRLLRPQATS